MDITRTEALDVRRALSPEKGVPHGYDAPRLLEGPYA